MIPHTAPPVWPESRPGKFGATVYLNSPELFERPGRDRQVIDKCRVGLIGLTDDRGVEMNGGRVGAREGPHAFRAALAKYGAAMPVEDEPPYPHVFDAGDVIAGEDLDETHRRVTEAAGAVIDMGLFPVGIGGGHDLTFPFVRAACARTGQGGGGAGRGGGGGGAMGVVYIDAHLDVRAEPGSGMPFRRLVEDCGVDSLLCIGLDPLVNTAQHFRWFAEHGGVAITADRLLSRPGAVAEIAGPAVWPDMPLAVSIDLDAIDAAHAPGVSAMNPCGLTPMIVGELAYLAGRDERVRCFDIMELCPPRDESGRTARLAAHLFLRFLRGYAERPR